MIYNNNFTDTEAPVDEATLNRVEKELKFTFPDEIRQHYLAINGGCPERPLFRKDDSIFVVQEFLPIRHGREDELFEDVCRDLRNERAIIPRHLIPFAIDPGGDYFCFGTKAGTVGAIYYFCGEYIDEPEGPLTLLADSLREFIERLEEDTDEEDDEDDEE